MVQLVIAFYQCQLVDACSVGELFYISMSSVFLSTEVCFLYGASPCWLWHKHTMYKWPNTHGLTHTPHLASGKKWVLPYHYIPLPLCLTYLYSISICTYLTAAFNLIPNGFICLFTSLLGITAQARKLQKSRSRVTSTLIERTLGRSHKLWRSKSEMDLLDSDTETKQGTDRDKCHKDRSESLNQASAQSYKSPKTSPEQNHTDSLAVPTEGDGGSQAKTETLCPSRPRGEREGEESEREETESSDDNTTQYSIHPPHDCPYLLLLQGCSLTQVSHSDTHSVVEFLSRRSYFGPPLVLEVKVPLIFLIDVTWLTNW